MILGGADVSFFLCFVFGLGTTRFRADLIVSFSNSNSNFVFSFGG